MENPEVWIVKGLVINRGDTMVLTTHQNWTPDQMMEFKGQIETHLATMGLSDVHVMVISGADASKITR